MAQKLHITGGKPLRGHVTVSGSKNAATKMMVASLLTDEPVTLHNVPAIGDTALTAEICRAVGTRIETNGNTLRLETPTLTSSVVAEMSTLNRISILALSPLLTRVGKAKVPVVGGDRIGTRPVNFHLDALSQMGATITQTDTAYIAEVKGKLRGVVIELPYPSVGATENIILAAVLAEGRTTILGAAGEPEIVDQIKLLQQMGAIIEFRANRAIVIDGVDRLHGASYTVMPDRLEAASMAALAIATGGQIEVQNARQEDLITFLNTLRRIGADYEVGSDSITFRRGSHPLIGIDIETDTHPGFATDWQQALTIILTQAKGLSVVHETVYENRFGYTETLNQMGASIGVFSKCLGELNCRFKGLSQKHSAVVNGPAKLRGAKVTIPDIRAGMAQVIAACAAEGDSELAGVEHLFRGYEDLPGKLRSVGAQFETV